MVKWLKTKREIISMVLLNKELGGEVLKGTKLDALEKVVKFPQQPPEALHNLMVPVHLTSKIHKEIEDHPNPSNVPDYAKLSLVLTPHLREELMGSISLETVRTYVADVNGLLFRRYPDGSLAEISEKHLNELTGVNGPRLMYLQSNIARIAAQNEYMMKQRTYDDKRAQFYAALSIKYSELLNTLWNIISGKVIRGAAKAFLVERVGLLDIEQRIPEFFRVFDERFLLTKVEDQVKIHDLLYSTKVMDLNLAPQSFINFKLDLRNVYEDLVNVKITDKELVHIILPRLPPIYHGDVKELLNLFETQPFIDSRNLSTSLTSSVQGELDEAASRLKMLQEAVAEEEKDEGDDINSNSTASAELVAPVLETMMKLLTSMATSTSSTKGGMSRSREVINLTYVTKVLQKTFLTKVQNVKGFKTLENVDIFSLMVKGKLPNRNNRRFRKTKEKKSGELGAKTEEGQARQVKTPCTHAKCVAKGLLHEASKCFHLIGFPDKFRKVERKEEDDDPIFATVTISASSTSLQQKVPANYFLDDPGSTSDVVYNPTLLHSMIPLQGQCNGIAQASIKGVGSLLAEVQDVNGVWRTLYLKTVFFVPSSHCSIMGTAPKSSRMVDGVLVPQRETKVPHLKFKVSRERYHSFPLVDYKDSPFNWLKIRSLSAPYSPIQQKFLDDAHEVNLLIAHQLEQQLLVQAVQTFSVASKDVVELNESSVVSSAPAHSPIEVPIVSPVSSSTASSSPAVPKVPKSQPKVQFASDLKFHVNHIDHKTLEELISLHKQLVEPSIDDGTNYQH